MVVRMLDDWLGNSIYSCVENGLYGREYFWCNEVASLSIKLSTYV